MVIALCAFAQPASSVDLEPETLEGFDHYVQLLETEINNQHSQQAFLWIDRLPRDQRAVAQSQLAAGQVIIERLDVNRPDDPDGSGKPIPVPGGLIHHWIGTVFIPGASLADTLALEQDYDHHELYFRPDVVRSKILSREGSDFTVLLRLYQKKVITTVLDTDHQVHYELVDSRHAWSRSRTTRIQQVDDAGEASERLEPVGHDDGFLWRMNTYWRFEERDGGTYVECQSVSLTRDIPKGLGWLIGPYVTSIPRESLTFTLATTRSAVGKRIASRAAP
jgi:hypothetical protein